MPLTDTVIKNTKPQEKQFKLYDTGGLLLIVTPKGHKWWRLKYRFKGKEKSISLGVYPEISLKDARLLRDDARKLLASGIDPSAQRKQEEAALLAEQKEEENTFEAIAKEWFASYSPSLTPKHADKLSRYFQKILFPAIGKISVTRIEPPMILEAIRPIEAKGHIHTAHKLMQFCGQVLQYAHITGLIQYNVASGLSKALQSRRSENLPAITNPAEIGRLLRDIDALEGYPSIIYFLKILPYVFTRQSELRLAQWSEFSFDEALWRIPASRMKMRKKHSVPLSLQVIHLLEELRNFSGSGVYLFPSIRASTATISDAGPLAALRRLGYTKEEMCLHGFRTMASTRLNELGDFRGDIIEAQLAHKEPDAVRLAYNRAEYNEERRRLMQTWADYLDRLREENSNLK